MKRNWLYWYICLHVMVTTSFKIYSIAAPASFGKTHFIIGADHKKIAKRTSIDNSILQKLQASSNGVIEQVFFSPDHDIRSILIDLIKAEQKHIKLAGFMITDSMITNALIDAYRRGIVVEVITDKACIQCEYGKAEHLAQAGVPVFVYSPPSNPDQSNCMHDKFVVFHKNLQNKSIFSTGSYNFTVAANKRNQENAVISESKHLFNKFDNQFNIIKNRCVPYNHVTIVQKVHGKSVATSKVVSNISKE